MKVWIVTRHGRFVGVRRTRDLARALALELALAKLRDGRRTEHRWLLLDYVPNPDPLSGSPARVKKGRTGDRAELQLAVAPRQVQRTGYVVDSAELD